MSKYINGTDKVLYIKYNDVYYPIGCLTSNSFTESVTMLQTTVRTNKKGWETSVPTNQRYSISFSGLVTKDWLEAGVVTFQQIRAFKRERMLLDWKISDGSENNEFGQGYITEVADQANIDEFVSFNGSMTGYGEPSNVFDSIYYGYKDRVEAAGGELTSEVCTQKYIDKLITT